MGGSFWMKQRFPISAYRGNRPLVWCMDEGEGKQDVADGECGPSGRKSLKYTCG